MQNHSYDIYVCPYNVEVFINRESNPEYHNAIQAKLDSFNNTQPVDPNFFTFIKTVSLDNLDGIDRTGCTTLNADIVSKSLYTRDRNRRIEFWDGRDGIYIQPEYRSNLSERICFTYDSVANSLDIFFPDNQDDVREPSDIFDLEPVRWELPSGSANGRILLHSKLHENNSWDLLNPFRRNSSNVSRISNFSFNNKSTSKRSRKSTKVSRKVRKSGIKRSKSHKNSKKKTRKKQSRKKHKSRKKSNAKGIPSKRSKSRKKKQRTKKSRSRKYKKCTKSTDHYNMF